MDKAKKRRIKKYITWVAMVAVVVTLTAMPLLANQKQEADGPQASILSGTVENGTIQTNLYGGGTLSTENAVEISLPEGVKISEFLVSNGDLVTEGQPLATIDRVSVMEAITSVQETLDYLVEEMADSTSQSTTTISAKTDGIIKQVFAEQGDDVQDVMLEHGALAVISLDGLMAVDIHRDTDLSTGDSVTVILADDSEIPGRVESNMEGILVVTVEDDGYAVGEGVFVMTADGDRIGSGELYVHNAWKAVAYSGTVSFVNAKAEDKAYSGKTLLTIKNEDMNPQREALAVQHRKYEALMLELFQLYQAESVVAPCDGMISGVDRESILLLSGGTDYVLNLLANAPGLDADAMYDNHVGQLTGLLGSQWLVSMNPESVEILDYKADMASIDTNPENLTVDTMMEMVTVYKLVDGQWEITTAQPGDILIFALGDTGFVWAVYVDHMDIGETTPSTPPSDLPSDIPTETPSEPDAEEPTIPEDSEETTKPESSAPDIGGILGGFTGGMMGGFGGGGMTQEEEFQLHSLEENLLMSVTPQNEVTLNISLSEWDIAKVAVGMPAEVTVEALHKQTFPAVITEIGDTGTNSGGSSQFTVTLTLEMQEDMLSGMTATATIPLYATENIPVIPVEALVEDITKTVVYTGYDESTGELINPVEVTLGVSDGLHTQILTGLSIGDSYWYRYYDTLEIDTSVKDSGFSFG